MSSTKTAATPSAGERASAKSTVSASPRPVGLSQQLGNQYLQMLLRARLMQAKLTVSHPQDVYEQEADRVAEHVMRMPAPVAPAGISAIQRRPADADERELRQSSGSESEVPTVDGATEHAIQSLSERGSALPGSVRAFMEPRFNADFSAVRVHNDAQAHELARAVNAQAFTVGRNVVFAAGRYAPETDGGKRLLAHELTHVVQQSSVAGPGRGPQSMESATTIEQRSSAAERSDSLAIARAATPALARAPDDWLKGTAPAPASTLDRWLSGPIWVRGLPYTEVTEAIDEIEQYLNRQAESSAKSVRLEEALHLLRSELRRQDEAAEPRAKRRRGRRARANAASRPASRPRILTSKSSVAYASLAEVRAEYDLIMQWLAVPDLPAKDRRILRVERTNLEPQLQSGRERVMLERHSTRVKAALTASDGSDPGAGLLTLARTIDGISKDPDNDAISYLHYQHERIAISAEQAAGLRNDLAHALEHTALRIFGDASLELDRYHKVVAQNDDQWLQARAAELFAGKLRGFDDPLGALQARFPRIGEDVRAIRRFVKAGRLADAAALLPRIEVLGREMAHVSRAFQKGYIEGAERAITVLELTAKAAAAIELSLLAVAAAPFVAGYVGGFVGAEGLGLTGLAGTAVTTVGTAAGTGTLVGGANVVLRGGETFAATLLTGHSLAEAWDASTEHAAQNFYDGFLAGAGGGAARVLAPALGVGANVAYQAGRRAAAEAIANGAVTMVQEYAKTGSIEKAIAAAARSAILAVPGAVIGGGSVKRLLAGSIAAAGTAYAGAIAAGASPNEAFQQASIALASHVAVSTVKHGNAKDAARVRRGQRAGQAVKRAVTKANPRSETQAATGSRDQADTSTAVSIHIPTDFEVAKTAPIPVAAVSAPTARARAAAITSATTDAPRASTTGGPSVANTPLPIVTGEHIRVGGFAREREAATPSVVPPTRKLVRGFARQDEPTDSAAEQESNGVPLATDNAADTTQRITTPPPVPPDLKVGGFNRDAERVAPDLAPPEVKVRGFGREGPAAGPVAEPLSDGVPLASDNAAQPTRPNANVHGVPVAGPTDTRQKIHPDAVVNEPPAQVHGFARGRGAPQRVRSIDADTIEIRIPTAEPDTVGGAGRPARPLPVPRAPAESPERLFERLEQGIHRRAAVASVAGEVAHPPPAGRFRGDLKTADTAYDAYNEALALSAGREVGIYHDPVTGTFAVMIGSEGGVWSPAGAWNALVHFHPVPPGKVRYRLPAPADFMGMRLRMIRGEEGHMREFIEFDIPGVGRGRTEYGINPANADEPVYVRIHWPDRPPETLTFVNDLSYRKHWDSFTVHTEKGSPEWEAMLRDMRDYDRYSLPRRGGPGQRTMAGDNGAPPRKGKPPASSQDRDADFASEAPTPTANPQRKGKVRNRNNDFDDEADTVVKHPDSALDAGEINVPDMAPSPTGGGKVTTGPTIVVTDPEMAERAVAGGDESLSKRVRDEQALKKAKAEADAKVRAEAKGQRIEDAEAEIADRAMMRIEVKARTEAKGQADGAESRARQAAAKGAAALFRNHLERGPAALFAEHMKPTHREGVVKYNRGEIGNSVRDLDLSGKTAQEIHELLIQRGFTHTSDVLRDFSANANPKGRVQTDATGTPIAQHFYIHPDGGMVRVKPQGDPASVRKQPQASKSVLYPPTAPASDFDSEACKVTNDGIAVPTRLNDLRNPYPKGTPEHTEFTRAWGDVSHMNL